MSAEEVQNQVERSLEQELRDEIRKSLLDAERDFNEQLDHIAGFERAVQAVESMDRFLNDQRSTLVDTGDLQSKVAESRAFLDEMINKMYEDPSFRFDFGEWADELDADIRQSNPMCISLASDMEGSFGWDGGSGDFHRQGASHSGGRLRAPESVKSFLHILQTNGKFGTDVDKLQMSKEDKKTYMWATYMAWTVAVLGMLIALSFLTRDFYIAHTNYAIHIDRKKITVPYPAVTLCSHSPGIPFFSEFPNERYKGQPLLGISQIVTKDSEGKETTTVYPRTLASNGSLVEEVFSGPNPEFCRNLKRETSLNIDQESLFKLDDIFSTTGGLQSQNEDYCYWCLRVGGTKPIMAPESNLEHSDPSSPPYSITFFLSKFFSGCRSFGYSTGFRSKKVRDLFAEQMRLHAAALRSRGILDFGDYPPGNNKYDSLQTVRHGFNHNELLGFGDFKDSMEFACNVYFYSGYFYPTANQPDIRYRFEYANKSWVPTGKGPYFTVQSWEKDAKDIVGPGQDVGRDLYSIDNLQVMFEDPDIIGKDYSASFVDLSKKISHIDGSASQTQYMDIERRNVRGVIEYETNVQEIGTQKMEAQGVYGFSIALAYKSEMTEEISSISTVGWSQYFTDLFEFIGLFTGVCVFTLLVAPAHSLVATTGESSTQSATGST